MLPEKRKGRELAKIPEDVLEGKITLNTDQKEVLRDFFTGMRYGCVPAQVAECKGPSCKQVSNCYLAKWNKLPDPGSKCPIEEGFIKIWTRDAIDELDVGPRDGVDQAQVAVIVSMRLTEWRLQSKLATEDVIISVFKSMALDGTPLFEDKAHPVFNELRENAKVRDKVLQSLIATREAKAKDGARGASAAEAAATLIEKIKDLKLADAEVKDVPKQLPDAQETE